MPRSCCVPGCKSNYSSTLNSGSTLISSLGFPKDEILTNKWYKTIPCDDWCPSKYSVECSLHFLADEIIREDIHVYQLPDGTVKKIPTTIKLKSGAAISIFSNLTKYI
nr:unnamed protein product [Callosobruchus chinensis]